MLLKDRVVLITNVEKFAGHGTTSVALAQGAMVLAHDPAFEAPSARRNPISDRRSKTEMTMMFATPTAPTSSDTAPRPRNRPL